MTVPHSTEAPPRLWTRAGLIEVAANLLAIIVIPLVARALYPVVAGPLTGLGFGEFIDSVSGRGGFTDVGWEVAASAGLVDPAYGAYDGISTLAPLIGMPAYSDGAISHPPSSLVLGIPLVPVDYGWWLAFWVVASISAIALSMRLMRVPAWVAYPLGVGLCLTAPGMFGTRTTYPLAALLLAAAWTYRNRPLISGVAYGLLTASRGISGLLLVYPLVRRQWRTLAVAVGIVVTLTAVALLLEPDSLRGFLVEGRASIADSMERLDVYSFDSLSAMLGLPRWLPWIPAVILVIVGWRLGRDRFWLLVWLTQAVTPLAWSQTPLQAIPLGVAIWQSGRLGRFLALTMGILLAVTAPIGWNLAWPVLVVISGVAVLACPLGEGASSTTESTTPVTKDAP